MITDEQIQLQNLEKPNSKLEEMVSLILDSLAVIAVNIKFPPEATQMLFRFEDLLLALKFFEKSSDNYQDVVDAVKLLISQKIIIFESKSPIIVGPWIVDRFFPQGEEYFSINIKFLKTKH